MRPFTTICLSCVYLMLFSCSGYQLGARKPQRLEEIKTLHIPLAINNTQFPRAAATTTNTVADAIMSTGVYSLGTEDKADASLLLKLVSITYNQSISDVRDSLRSEEIEMRVLVEWSVTGANGSILVPKQRSTGRTRLFIEDNQQVARAYVLPDALEQAATKIATRLSFSF